MAGRVTPKIPEKIGEQRSELQLDPVDFQAKLDKPLSTSREVLIVVELRQKACLMRQFMNNGGQKRLDLRKTQCNLEEGFKTPQNDMGIRDQKCTFLEIVQVAFVFVYHCVQVKAAAISKL